MTIDDAPTVRFAVPVADTVPRRHRLAIVAISTAGAAFLFAVTVPALGGLLSLVAIVLGGIALVRVRGHRRPGKGLAVGAVVGGFVALIVASAMTPTPSQQVRPESHPAPASSSVADSPAPPAPSAPPAPVAVAPLAPPPPSPSPAPARRPIPVAAPRTTDVDSSVATPSVPSAGVGDPTAGEYTNARGNEVESPDGSAAGASARCADGTYSHSQTRSGTCSHHGGIAK